MSTAMNARLDLILTELRLPSIKRLAPDLCEQSDREEIGRASCRERVYSSV